MNRHDKAGAASVKVALSASTTEAAFDRRYWYQSNCANSQSSWEFRQRASFEKIRWKRRSGRSFARAKQLRRRLQSWSGEDHAMLIED